MKILFLIILTLLSMGCGITKRQHLSGWYIPPIQKIHLKTDKTNFQNPEISKTYSAKEDLNKVPKNDVLNSRKSNPIAIENTTKSTLIPHEKKNDEFSNSSMESRSAIEKNNFSNSQTIRVTKEKIKQASAVRPKLSKGAKVFWLTILFIVLFGAFVVCGALWPVVYIVWFGVTALIALFGASTGGDSGSFGERIGAFFLFILIGLLYVWIYLYFPLMWPAIFLQLFIYGGIGLIGLVIWAILKTKKKKAAFKSEKS